MNSKRKIKKKHNNEVEKSPMNKNKISEVKKEMLQSHKIRVHKKFYQWNNYKNN